MEATYDNSTDTAIENDTKLPDEIKCSYTEPDAYLTEKSTDVPDNCQHFEDDFGPETDVDTLDDAHPVKSPPECPTSAMVDDSSLINGVKPFSLENKIMQHLSEHNKDFLADSSPFGNDPEGQYSNQSTIDNQMLEQSVTKSSDINSEAFVDNKIIDALESLESVISDEKYDNERSYSTKKTAEIVDFSEKVDYVHEKSIFSVDNTTDKSTDTLYHTTTNDLESKEDHDRPLSGLASNLIEVDAACVEGSVEEESEEEEEWNYFKADKDTTCPEIEATNEAITSELVIESTDARIAAENPVDDFTPVCTEATSEAGAQLTDEKHEQIKELDHSDHNGKDDTLDDQKTQHECLVHSTEKESAHEKELADDKDFGEIQVSDSRVDVVETTDQCLDLASACEKALTISTENTYEEELTTAQVNAEGDLELREQKVLTLDLETSVNGQVDRPDNLNLEMASKLNPEAKEFVPTGSPSRSNPSSPSSSVPTPLQNAYLMLSDDIVIAQSPKKGGSDTMDNIDVPTENEFQKEMDSRPHELEKTSEYLNGNNPEGINRAHSPGSEPSYQEMNLKEAMQCDEKLDFEYNDEKQAIIEDTSSDTSSDKHLLNVLVKEQNAMNMSFYEGRDEALLPTKTDELNKVQILPNDDDIVQDNVEEVLDDIKLNESLTIPTEVPMDSTIDPDKCMDKQTFDTSHLEPDVHTTGALVHENPPSAILTIATQVVNDVTALVDEMLIDAPKTDIRHEEIRISESDEKPVEKQDVIMELQVPDENKEILVNIDSHPIEKTSEGSIEVEIIPQDSPADHYIPMKRDVVSPSTVSDELVSPMLEVQQEIVAENEFIMDESVLNVSSPVMDNAKFETNDSSFTTTGTTERHYENEINCLLQVESNIINKHVAEPIISMEEPLVSENKDPENEHCDETKGNASEIVATPSAELVISNDVNKSATTKPASASKTPSAIGKSSKLASVGTEKKTSTINKPLPKASSKPVSAAKPTTSPIKKITAVSTTSTSTSITKSSSVSKAAITSTARTSSSSVSKTIEKKILPVAKKPPAVAVNGEMKPQSAARKTVTSTVKAPPTKPVSSSLASSRPPSTTTAKPLSTAATTAKTASISSSAKTGPSAAPSRSTTTTTRTSTLSAKPRTTATTKSASSTSTLTSTSKTSHVPSTVKRVSTVQSAPLKTNVSSKNTTITKTTTVPSRTSVTSKPATSPAGARKAAPTSNKKPLSSPATKINTKSSPTGKSEPSKVAGLNHSEIIPSNDTTRSGMLDKQLKNDNNELITKNGIDSPVMVIDSAAD